MSIDFELYTMRPVSLPNTPELHQGQLRLDGPDQAETEDIPPHFLDVLGKKRCLYRIHLEGVVTDAERARIDAWLHDLIARSKGVLIDCQTERFESTVKSGQLRPLQQAATSPGWMSFYFQDAEGFYATGFAQMLDTVERMLPKALPKRYGYFEPLQSRVQNSDISGLLTDFQQDTSLLIKAAAPFGDIMMSLPCRKTFESYHPRHFIRRNFLLGTVSFELRQRIFQSPPEMARLMALFEALSVELNVVYSEITQQDTLAGWHWNGLPDNHPHSLCLGPAYVSLCASSWPEALSSGRTIGEQHLLISSDRLGNAPPKPPRVMLAPEQNSELPPEIRTLT